MKAVDSPDPIDQTRNRWLPFLGALQFDLRGMLRSRVVQGWLALTALFAFAAMMDALSKKVTAPQMLTKVFAGYILVWSTVVIIISAGAVAAESGVVADAILSRGITRYAYILSKYLSRLITALVVCGVVLVPLSIFASVHLSGSVEATGIASSLLIVLAHVTFLTILGVTFSIWFDRAIVGIAVLWLMCYFFGSICSALDMGFMTPMRLIGSIASSLSGNVDGTNLWHVCLAFGLPSIALGALGTLLFARRDV
jgi:ABC-2 type transport system permease protein